MTITIFYLINDIQRGDIINKSIFQNFPFQNLFGNIINKNSPKLSIQNLCNRTMYLFIFVKVCATYVN